MSALIDAMRELVTGNRILAHEGVLDAYGHITVRHPDDPNKFLMSRSRSPEHVSLADIVTFKLDCTPIDDLGRPLYSERPIHGAIYQARPDVHSVVHNHSYDVIPFSVTKFPLKPLAHVAAAIGPEIPVWDMATKFGDKTDLLVRQMEQGRDLAQKLGSGNVVLMRGHGCAVAGKSLRGAVMAALYLQVNARMVLSAVRMGAGNDIRYLSKGEVETWMAQTTGANFYDRPWEYLTKRAGCDDL